MKQDEKGGKRFADGVGSACTPALVGADYGRDLAVPPFPHHPTIERSAFDEKNYRPIFHHA